ncbi:EamA family transporter [Gorillibacterium massiliense]|uniref:EamA family transporter n=1 Tax=Gorillibacterium massiliense TaxID=1280390 RepID=UPI0004B9C96C|nr:EamA family transporter [Gorillibacterium massiliense]
MIALLIVLCNVILLVSGQILWKNALNRHPQAFRSVGDFFHLIIDPVMLAGCCLFVLATVIWFYALSRYDLSRIYPLQSIAYVLGALSGILIFKESMSLVQWAGVLLILGGAFLVAKA